MIPKYVTHYIDAYKNGEVVFNKERKMLIEHLELNILPNEDLYFDNDHIESFIKFTEKFFFELQPFQKFLVSFIFLYEKETNDIYFDTFLFLVARGAGKNGLISALSAYFTSPLHGVKAYDGTVVANSEDQAKVSFEEFYEMVQNNQLENTRDNKGFYNLTKLMITGLDTNSTFKFATSNAKTKDGGRQGFIIYDEIHQYEDRQIVDVLSSGLGKVKNAREFFIGTDGFVREGFLDQMKDRAEAILKGETPEDRMFPFICKLDNAEEIHDSQLWSKANPMFEFELSDYARTLFRRVETEYKNLKHSPSSRENFMTKRMNLPEVDSSKVVASYEDILETNQDIPILKGKTAIGGVDYASIRDFAAVGLLFKHGDKVVWLSHSFARKGYLEEVQLKPPIKEWERQGLLTIVDEPTINPVHIVNWFIEKRNQYPIQEIIADNFRMDLLRPLFEEAGFDIEVIRNPRGVHSLLAPKVETLFANHNVIFGDNPLMRWYTNNIAVKIDKQGNKTFEKKDEHRRKTDGFQAFIHALYKIDEIQEVDLGRALDMLEMIDF